MQLDNDKARDFEAPLSSLLQSVGEQQDDLSPHNMPAAKSIRQPDLPRLPVPEALAAPLSKDENKKFMQEIGLWPHGASDPETVITEALKTLFQDREPKNLKAVLVPGVMVQLRFTPEKCQGFDVRVHMFLDVVEPIVHNHARPFLSLLLYGGYIHKLWHVCEGADGNCVSWERRNGTFKLAQPLRKGTATLLSQYRRQVGDVLLHGTNMYHTVEAATELAVALPCPSEAKKRIRMSVKEGKMQVVAITLIARPCTDRNEAATMWVPTRDGTSGGTHEPPNDAEEVLNNEQALSILELFRSLTLPLLGGTNANSDVTHRHV